MQTADTEASSKEIHFLDCQERYPGMHTALTLVSTSLHLNGPPGQGTIHTLSFALYKKTCEAGIVISVLSMTKQSRQRVPGFGQALGGDRA